MAILGAACMTGLALTTAAEATPLRFNFSGRGTSGTILFDDSIPDANPDPLKGQYLGAIQSFTVNINGTPDTGTGIPTFETLQGSTGSVVIGLGADGIGGCGLTVDCLEFLLGSNVFPPSDPLAFDLSFVYPAGSFTSDMLPTAVPATGAAILRNDTRQFFLGREAESSVNPASVPEPSTWLLLGTGVGIMAVVRFLKL